MVPVWIFFPVFDVYADSKVTVGMMDKNTTIKQFAVHDPVLVRCSSGNVRKGSVLYIRHDGESLEYLIHYEGKDKRLDEYVTEERLMRGFQIKAEELTPVNGIEHEVIAEENSTVDLQVGPSAGVGGESTSVRRSKRKDTKLKKRKLQEFEMPPDVLDERALEEEHENMTKIKYIERIQFGNISVKTWYFSPYPEPFGKLKELFICEFCLKYMSLQKSLKYHLSQCRIRKPCGKEIYSHDYLSVFEVDGAKDKLYCQLLCLLGKLFLDHKALSYDVRDFMFYVATYYDGKGCHMIGYFSKEKNSEERHNVNCIMTLPPYQRKGYGTFLIAFSYELSKLEGKVGGPERPLSDMAVLAYQSYWRFAVLKAMKDLAAQNTRLQIILDDPEIRSKNCYLTVSVDAAGMAEVSLPELSRLTGMEIDDIVSTLRHLCDADQSVIDTDASEGVFTIGHHFMKVGGPNANPSDLPEDMIPKILPVPGKINLRLGEEAKAPRHSEGRSKKFCSKNITKLRQHKK